MSFSHKRFRAFIGTFGKLSNTNLLTLMSDTWVLTLNAARYSCPNWVIRRQSESVWFSRLCSGMQTSRTFEKCLRGACESTLGSSGWGVGKVFVNLCVAVSFSEIWVESVDFSQKQSVKNVVPLSGILARLFLFLARGGYCTWVFCLMQEIDALISWDIAPSLEKWMFARLPCWYPKKFSWKRSLPRGFMTALRSVACCSRLSAKFEFQNDFRHLLFEIIFLLLRLLVF